MKMLEQGQISEAVECAESLEGDHSLVARFQALTFTEAGSLTGDKDLLQRGAEGWRRLDDETDPTIPYNLANAELELWNLACKGHRYVAAFEPINIFVRRGISSSGLAGIRSVRSTCGCRRSPTSVIALTISVASTRHTAAGAK
jgi:hypothetical protein